jgi:hypothetical protein
MIIKKSYQTKPPICYNIKMRPGYLAGYVGNVPRRLGDFGWKDEIEPMPGAPPPPPCPPKKKCPDPKGPKPVKLKDYIQDPRCKEKGHRMMSIKCEGKDCDPGETEWSCEEDPIYKKLVTKEKSSTKKISQVKEKVKLEMEMKRLKEKRSQLKLEKQRRIKEAERIRLEQQLFQRRQEEKAMMKNYLILGGGGLVVIGLLTLIFKLKS